MAKYSGKGWHFQSERHSRARKTGRAGGVYESARISAIINKHPEYKNLTFKQLKNKGVFLRYQADADKDGTKNIHDCRPLNKKKQDDNRVAGWHDIGHEEKSVEVEPIAGTRLYAEKTSKKSKFKEGLSKAGRYAKKELVIGAEKTKAFVVKETEKLAEEIKKAREKAQIEHEEKKERLREFRLQELSGTLGTEVSDEKDIDVKALSEEQLKQLAVITPQGFFGDNRYEKELKRRIEAEANLKADLIIEKMKASSKAEERIRKEKESDKPTKYFWEK